MTPEPIELLEYEARNDLRLAEEVVRALSGSPYVALSPSRSGEGWTIRAKQFIGVLQIGEVEIRVRPKIPVGNVLFLLAYAKDQRGWRDLLTTMDVSKDLVSAIAIGFVHQTSVVLQQGVLQGYAEREEALHVVRGRIRTVDQLTRRFGLPLPLEVRFDEFSPDIQENRILRSALERVCAMPGIPEGVVRVGRHLIGRLSGVSLLKTTVPEVRYTRLNERYRGAITLGTLILQARSLQFRRGEVTTTGFLFDMNRIFEDFVSAALLKHFEASPFSLRLQRSRALDRRDKIWLRPDLTWWRNGKCVGVADVKYKSLATAELPNADVYQVLTYCTAHGLTRGHLVYAAGNEDAVTHEVRNSPISIDVRVLDLSDDPNDLLVEVGRLQGQLESEMRLEETPTSFVVNSA